MKTFILFTAFAYLQISCAFMTVNEFEASNLLRCYDTNMQDNRRTSERNINGQVLPLPNSVETFISLVEGYESLNPNEQARDTVGKLLKSFRIDDLHPVVDEETKLRDTAAFMQNRIKRILLSVPDTIQYQFNENDFTDDEKCALHFMLSHTINDTLVDANDEVVDDTNRVKHPREYGIVSLHSKRKHAFALGRVLLGIYAALLPSNSVDLKTILQKEKSPALNDNLQDAKVNFVYAVTIGDLVTRLVVKDEVKFLGNGEWTDISCPIEYRLEDNTGGFVTYSELRGGVDGLIIGKKMQESRQEFSNFRLSQILRQYYGYSGLVDPGRTRWCFRETNFQSMPDFEIEMYSFNRLYRAMSDGGSVREKTQFKINGVINDIRNNIFKDVEKDECSISELSIERKFVSPKNIFAILDSSSSGATKLNFQAEVIGNLSTDFDLRPRGNLMGVYSNLKALQQNTLDVIVKNSGTAGCPSCFAKYYTRTGNKEDDAELFKDLNDTLTTFDRDQNLLEERYMSEAKPASPGKTILFFNFGSQSPDYRVQEALWELKRSYRGLTILAIGENREILNHFVDNDQTDVFSGSLKTIYDIKQRLNKVPAEFTYKVCNQSTSSWTDSKQVAFIPPNKMQYWAMYPQYFLKSYEIKMKFRPQEGTYIRVCYSRWYGSIMEGKSENCKDSAGGEIEFFASNPCYKRDVFTCEPFYFSVEGKKQPTSYCQSLMCSTPNDIQFEFEHQGISCNTASYVNLSVLALLFATLFYYLQQQ